MNILEGPGMYVHNVTLSKEFRITERMHFDFMAMAGNLCNHPNFLNPASNISVPGQAGTVSQTPDLYSGTRLRALDRTARPHPVLTTLRHNQN